MKNLILLIGLFSTTFCFSADKNIEDASPIKRQRGPATRRVHFAPSVKEHDGLSQETKQKEELIYTHFEMKSIKSKEDIALLIKDKKFILPKESLIKILEELNDLVTQIKEKREARVISCAYGRGLKLQEIHKAHLENLITFFSDYIHNISASK
jgi:hypothetical protein